MEDTWGDGWNGGAYSFYDTTTAETIAFSTLSSGSQGTDVICFSKTGCYTLSLTSGTYPGEISWSFGGTVSGGAPCVNGFYVTDDDDDDDDDGGACDDDASSPAFLWLEEDGTLAAGSDCGASG